MRIRAGASTDVGRVRQNNEDAHLVSPPLYAVADGMGGGAAGEVASGIAMKTLGDFVQSGNGHPPTLSEWVLAANRAIYQRALERPDEAGMGTTITAVLAEDDRLRLAHVGDSRAYLLRNGELTQLTEDHTRVHRMLQEGLLTEDEAAVHPQRNVVTRALGIGETVQVDETVVRVKEGDRLLLCSDGLSGMVAHDAIRDILASASDPQEAAGRLVAAANEAGGVDNITAVVLDVDEVPDSADATIADDPPSAGQTLVADGGPSAGPAAPTQPGQAPSTRTPPAPPPPAPVPPVGTVRGRSRTAIVAVVAIAIVAAVAVGVALALGGGSGKPGPTATPVATQASPAALEKQSVQSFDRQLASALPGHGPVEPTVFPRLPSDLDRLGRTTGKVPAALAARIDDDASQSTLAVRGIQGIDVEKIVPPQFAKTRTQLLEVRSVMLKALQQYQDVASLMQRAAAAGGKQRTNLVDRARTEEQRARAQYRTGYDALAAVWRQVGIPVPPSPSPTPAKTPTPTTAPSKGQGPTPTPQPSRTTNPAPPPTPAVSCSTLPVIGGCSPKTP